jgi:hypothetical protein
VATVTNGTVKIIGAGTCEIIAYQEGDTTFLPANKVNQKLTVNKGNQTITFPELLPKATGDPDFDAGATSSSGLVCTLTSSNPAVATIVNGLIQIKGAGSSVITAKQAGNVNYNAASEVSQELIVTVKTSADLLSVANDFEIFPNPASDFITVKFNSIHSTVVIYNLVGVIVYSNSTPSSEIKIPVSLIGEAGVYFVKVNSTIKKFVIAK